MAYRSKSRLGVFYTPGFPPAVKWLLISNSALFILAFFAKLAGIGRIFDYLALTPAAVVKDLYVWQLATYMFLHAGFLHILFNMLTLWWFGAELEQLWGTRRFVNFYMTCGVGAGVAVVALNYLLPWGNPGLATVGASGAVLGLLMAFAMLFPNRTMMWNFLIPIQMKWFVLIMVVVTLMMSFQSGNGVSSFAHLGGLFVGWVLMKMPRGTSFSLVGPARAAYKQWKLRRAKKKFEVWMRRHGGDLQ